jgi:hypothetical protein
MAAGDIGGGEALTSPGMVGDKRSGMSLQPEPSLQPPPDSTYARLHHPSLSPRLIHFLHHHVHLQQTLHHRPRSTEQKGPHPRRFQRTYPGRQNHKPCGRPFALAHPDSAHPCHLAHRRRSPYHQVCPRKPYVCSRRVRLALTSRKSRGCCRHPHVPSRPPRRQSRGKALTQARRRGAQISALARRHLPR